MVSNSEDIASFLGMSTTPGTDPPDKLPPATKRGTKRTQKEYVEEHTASEAAPAPSASSSSAAAAAAAAASATVESTTPNNDEGTDRPSTKKLRPEDMPHVVTELSPEELVRIAERTASSNGRKSKCRRHGPDPADIPSLMIQPPVNTNGDVQPFDISKQVASKLTTGVSEPVDEWTQLLRDPSPFECSPVDACRSAAAALRETIRIQEEQVKLGESGKEEVVDVLDPNVATGGGTASGVDLSDSPPAGATLTIKEFFAGDFQTPLTGLAADAHELFTRVQKELQETNACASAASASATKSKPTATARKNAEESLPEDVEERGTDAVCAEAEDKTGGPVHYEMLEECGTAYCGDFLREAREEEYGERPCIRGRNCVFMLIAGQYPEKASETVSQARFVCREFLRPKEVKHWLKTRDLPAVRRTCLGCNRLITSMWYHTYKLNGQQPDFLLQDHYNKVDDSKDGYDQAHCLSMTSNSGEWCGIVLPFMDFEDMRFTPTVFTLHARATGQTWTLKGVQESQVDFRDSPSNYYREAAEEIVARAVKAAAIARGDFATVNEVDDIRAQQAEDRRVTVTAALVVRKDRGGPPVARPPPPPPVWVAGSKGMEIGGVPPVRPFRTSEWIAAEEAIRAPVYNAGPLEPFTPRLLLGRMFPQLSDTVFCTFEDTVAFVRSDPLRFLERLGLRLLRYPRMHSFQSSILKRVHDDIADYAARIRESDGVQPVSPPRYSIVAAILWRIDHATSLARVHFRRGSGSYWLQLFIDTHIDLVIHMQTQHVYEDASLEDPMANDESLYESYLEMYMPHDTRCIHSGDLPDLSGILQYGSIWYRTSRRAYADSIMEALDHLIIYKSQQHKCKVRNLAKILHGYACQHPQLMTILRGIITVSLLGNYAHAEIRPSFETRLHIVYSMRSSVCDDRSLFHWVHENDAIVHGALKEFYRFTVSLKLGFETVLLLTTYWKTVSRTICMGMDQVRSLLPLTISGGHLTGKPSFGDPLQQRSVMEAASESLRSNHKKIQLQMIHKSRKGTFTDALIIDMNHFFAAKVLDTKIVRPQSSLTELAGIVGRDTAEFVLRAMWRVMQTHIPQHRTEEPVELGWLSFFGVTNNGMLLLRTLAYDFQMKDIADNAMWKRVMAIYANCKQDFFLMHIFFTLINDWRSTQSFKLSANYVEAQRIALRAKWKILPFKPLPENADLFYYCPSCFHWLADVVDGFIPKTREKMQTIGFRHALYSEQTGHLYCGMQKRSVHIRKQVESGLYEDLDRKLKNSNEANRVRHYLQTPACALTPAVPVHMLGRVQLLDGRQYALCTICASLCPWEAQRFGPNGFTCGFHGKDAPVILTTRQEDAAVNKANKRHRRLNTCCSYCEEQLKPSGKYVRIYVIDDIPKQNADGDIIAPATNAYIRYILCAQCSHAVRTPEIVRVRSRVNRSIRNSREYFRMREAGLTRSRRNTHG